MIVKNSQPMSLITPSSEVLLTKDLNKLDITNYQTLKTILTVIPKFSGIYRVKITGYHDTNVASKYLKITVGNYEYSLAKFSDDPNAPSIITTDIPMEGGKITEIKGCNSMSNFHTYLKAISICGAVDDNSVMKEV